MPGQLGDDEKRQLNSTGWAGDAGPLPIPVRPGGTVVNRHRLFFIWVIFMTGKKLNNPILNRSNSTSLEMNAGRAQATPVNLRRR